MKDLFTMEYVQFVLNPFVGKELRMSADINSIPFLLETSIESTFQIELTISGIKFLLKDNFYIKRDLNIVLNKAFNEADLPAYKLDNFVKKVIDTNESNVAYTKIINYLSKEFNPQIAYTYYTMIKTLEVSGNMFVLNGVKFIITK